MSQFYTVGEQNFVYIYNTLTTKTTDWMTDIPVLTKYFLLTRSVTIRDESVKYIYIGALFCIYSNETPE